MTEKLKLEAELGSSSMKSLRYGARYKISVIDSRGNVLAELEKESDSFVYNYIVFVCSALAKAGYALRDEDGEYVPFIADDGTIRVRGALVEDGSGSSTLDTSIYRLESKIGESPVTFTSLARTTTRCDAYLRGTIMHDVPVTIREIGLAFKVIRITDGTERKVLIIRDVLPSPYDIPAGGGLIVEYNLYTLY